MREAAYQQMAALLDRGPSVLMAQAINWQPGKRRRFFWCPLCEQLRTKPRYANPWILKTDGKLVCVYILCRKCALCAVPSLSAIGLIERNLVRRYPHIAAALPPDYFGA